MLALGLMLDAVTGEPGWLWNRVPHPVVLFGRLIELLEKRLNDGDDRRLKGVAAVAVLVVVVGTVSWGLSLEVFRGVFEVLGAAILLAQRSLVDHVHAVAEALRVSVPHGRRAVAEIVGRDPEALDGPGVARAAIESAAENFSDGVVAPAFWFLVGGLPGIAVYKAVNTADSMIGHRSPRYLRFGWAAARLDDLMNWIPARLAGLIICAIGLGREAVGVMWRDAGKHRSPNAGWTEAALAASMDIALAGPRVYDGVRTDDPFVHAEGRRRLDPDDIDEAVRLLWKAWGVVLAVAVIGAVFGR